MRILNSSTLPVIFYTWILTSCSLVADERWNQFRGPFGSGVSVKCRIPDDLGEQYIKWKVDPGSGHSSPVVFENQVILTVYENDQWGVRSFDGRNGERLWEWLIEPSQIERGHRNGSPAASSVAVSQNGIIVAYSGAYGLIGVDISGKELWRMPMPTPVTQHGAGTSPVIFEDRVFLCVDQDINSFLICVSLQTGETLWRVDRPGFRRGFSTPMIWPGMDGVEPGILVCGTLRAIMYNIQDGAIQWSVSGFPNEMCATPVFVRESGRIFICGWTNGAGVSRLPDFSELLQTGDQDNDGVLTREESPQGSPARMHFPYVDADKDGTISREEYDSLIEIFRLSENSLMAVDVRRSEETGKPVPEVAWKFHRGLPYVPSPLAYMEHIYLVKNGGMVSCFSQSNGNPLYLQERLGEVGDYYASPVAAGGRILFCSQSGVMTIIMSGRDFEIVTRWDTGEMVFATPALTEDFIYLRTTKHLYGLQISDH